MITKVNEPKKRQDLPTTNQLQHLINNLKLSKPIIFQPHDSSPTIMRNNKGCSQNRSQFESVIQDDFSNYKCFEEIQRQYNQQCQKKTNQFKYENKVILRSPIYRLSEQKLLQASNFQRERTQQPNKKEKSLFQSTVSSKNKSSAINKSKEINIRRQLFPDKENCSSQNIMSQKGVKKDVDHEKGKIRVMHKFSNPQQFLKEKKK